MILTLTLLLYASFSLGPTMKSLGSIKIVNAADSTVVKIDSAIIQKEVVAYDSIFEDWYELIYTWEGGIGDRPLAEDSSGLTNHGITVHYWRMVAHKIVNKKPTKKALRTLTWQETKTIARSFWVTSNINTIKNASLRIMVAEAYWGSGPSAGLKSMGYKSIKHLNRDTHITPKILYTRRLAWLKKLKNWKHNKHGWRRRLNHDLELTNKYL